MVNNPDDTRGTPQVVLQVKPFPDSQYLCLFLLNYRDQPDFSGGGTQLQVWQNKTLQASAEYGTGVLGATANEKITVTLSMESKVSGTGLLNFGFKSLNSATWGQKDTLGVSVGRTRFGLAGYDTTDSVKNSVILLGAANVDSIKITEVRQYDTLGNLLKTESPVTVYSTSTDRSGHAPHLEEPALFNQILRDFAARLSRGRTVHPIES